MQTQSLRKHKRLAQELVDSINDQVRQRLLKVGDKLPTEAALESEFGVSRTVVREAISRLQAEGQVLTRHGIGTFVSGKNDHAVFALTAEHFATLRDVIAVMELRIGVEVEGAGLAAVRRTSKDLLSMESSLLGFTAAIEGGQNAVPADFQFHLDVTRATQNSHYERLLTSLGMSIIPRSRLEQKSGQKLDDENLTYLQRVHIEHENIYLAIKNQDSDAAKAAMRMHLSNSRERRRQLASKSEADRLQQPQ